MVSKLLIAVRMLLIQRKVDGKVPGVRHTKVKFPMSGISAIFEKFPILLEERAGLVSEGI